MSKRNIFLRIGVLMLIATLATSGVFVGSGTYAKYIASAQYEATGRVAKFDVRINGTTFSKADIGTPYAVTNATGFLGTLYQENCTTPHPGGAVTIATAARPGASRPPRRRAAPRVAARLGPHMPCGPLPRADGASPPMGQWRFSCDSHGCSHELPRVFSRLLRVPDWLSRRRWGQDASSGARV